MGELGETAKRAVQRVVARGLAAVKATTGRELLVAPDTNGFAVVADR